MKEANGTKTNFQWIKEALGRIERGVSTNRDHIDDLEIWRARIVGALGVISLLIVPILIYIGQQAFAK